MSRLMKEIKEGFLSGYHLFINGRWTEGSEGSKLTSYNPSNGEALAEFIEASHQDVDDAVRAAREAFNSWKEVDVKTRSRMLLQIADLIDQHAKRLAMIETLDNGKPLRETEGLDLPESADHFRYFAGVIRSEEDSLKILDKETFSLVIREPIGVVAQIIPWNFPLLMAAWKLAPALAAGNTIVIHPSSSTSLSLLELAKLLEKVLPPGVVNVITGKGANSGNYLINHEGIDKLAFTGSTEVGYKVAEAAAKRLIPATLELGGKSANIIFDDANWERALEGAQLAILFNQGQVCCAGSRLFLHEAIYHDFLAALKEKFEAIRVGLPWVEGVQMGSQVNEAQVQTILQYVEVGVKEGAELITGGAKIGGELAQGCFFQPTILAGSNELRIAQEEIFGPVVLVEKFSSEEEVIALANASEYGLAGGLFTNNLNRAFRVARALQTGRIWINTYNQIPAATPFGGYKKSGIGRETHKVMLDAYSQTKNIFFATKETTLGLY